MFVFVFVSIIITKEYINVSVELELKFESLFELGDVELDVFVFSTKSKIERSVSKKTSIQHNTQLAPFRRMTSSSGLVLLSRLQGGRIAQLTFNRPTKLNALSAEMVCVCLGFFFFFF